MSVSKLVASGSSDGELHVSELDGTPVAQLAAHASATQTVAQNDRNLISGSEDGSLQAYSLSSNNTQAAPSAGQRESYTTDRLLLPAKQLQAPSGVRSMHISGGALVVGCRDGHIRGWDLSRLTREPAWSHSSTSSDNCNRTAYGLVLLQKAVATVDGMGMLHVWPIKGSELRKYTQ